LQETYRVVISSGHQHFISWSTGSISRSKGQHPKFTQNIKMISNLNFWVFLLVKDTLFLQIGLVQMLWLAQSSALFFLKFWNNSPLGDLIWNDPLLAFMPWIIRLEKNYCNCLFNLYSEKQMTFKNWSDLLPRSAINLMRFFSPSKVKTRYVRLWRSFKKCKNVKPMIERGKIWNHLIQKDFLKH